MVTTELTSAKDPLARPLLQAAAKSGVRYFKTGYWHYSGIARRPRAARRGRRGARRAHRLGRECGIELGFHNHNGYVGAALWDIAPAMDRLDPKWAGYYFDPRHAVAEGGGGSWKAATHLVAPRLKMIALKDFFWEKTAKGWVIQNCPMGEGAVDWAWMARRQRGTIRRADLAAPRVRDPGLDRDGADHTNARGGGEGPGLRETIFQVKRSVAVSGASDPGCRSRRGWLFCRFLAGDDSPLRVTAARIRTKGN